MSAKELLDQLMGKDRNLTIDEKPKRKMRWDDEGVCPYYLNGFCPHDLFTNTKSDLGTCPKDHDPKLKDEYFREPPKARYHCESKFLRFLKDLAGEIDRKIDRGQARLNLKMTVDKDDPDYKEREEKKIQLNEKIATLLAEMEKLGEDGKVDESQAMLKLVDALRKEKEELEAAGPLALPSPWITDTTSSEKRMQVCPTCGSFLVVGDAEQRVQAHLNGKQHAGYKLIRDTAKVIEDRRAAEGKINEEVKIEETKLRSKSPVIRREREPIKEIAKVREEAERSRDRESRKRHRSREKKPRKRSKSRSHEKERKRSRRS